MENSLLSLPVTSVKILKLQDLQRCYKKTAQVWFMFTK